MLWKRPNLTRRIARVSVRQGPSRHPSLAYQRRDYSPEGTRVIPREQYVSLICPQISENLKIRRFLFILDPIFIRTGSEIFDAIDCTKDLFLPDPKYSYRILFYLYWIRNIHTGSYFIHTGSEFTELLLTILESSNIIVNRPLVWKIICTGSENTWVKPSNWLIL